MPSPGLGNIYVREIAHGEWGVRLWEGMLVLEDDETTFRHIVATRASLGLGELTAALEYCRQATLAAWRAGACSGERSDATMRLLRPAPRTAHLRRMVLGTATDLEADRRRRAEAEEREWRRLRRKRGEGQRRSPVLCPCGRRH